MKGMILVIIAMSYFIIIIFARDWFLRKPNLWIFLTISLILGIFCTLDTFVFKNWSQNILILNGALITMIVYLIFYKLYAIIFRRELAAPMECFYGNNM